MYSSQSDQKMNDSFPSLYIFKFIILRFKASFADLQGPP